MILHLLLPVLGLAAAAILLPRALARAMPESLAGLVLNGVLCAIALTLVSAGYFFLAYLARSTALIDLVGIAPGRTLGHFLMLGLASALIWAPILVLAVASIPKRWKEAVW